MESSHPTPHAADAWLRLALIPGLNPSSKHRLLAECGGSPQAVLAADASAIAGMAGGRVAQALSRGPSPRLLEKTLDWLSRPGNTLVTLADESYPERLRHVDEPPIVLYVQGRAELLAAPSFAIVGSRNGTVQGRTDAELFARAISEEGLCIVSGLALGIDAAAHRGGLAGPASSIAVVGTGLDRVYPPENSRLAAELASRGCVVSEFPLGTPPFAGNFPRRNRLITGLSLGVLVVEAGTESGSLITARLAADQGRDVFALPGSIHATLAKGCHRLIKEGAKLVETADDILGELRWKRRAAPASASREPDDPLLDALGFAPASFDEIVARTAIAVNEIAARLSLLEIEGRVEPMPGGRFRRVVPAAGA